MTPQNPAPTVVNLNPAQVFFLFLWLQIGFTVSGARNLGSSTATFSTLNIFALLLQIHCLCYTSTKLVRLVCGNFGAGFMLPSIRTHTHTNNRKRHRQIIFYDLSGTCEHFPISCVLSFYCVFAFPIR